MLGTDGLMVLTLHALVSHKPRTIRLFPKSSNMGTLFCATHESLPPFLNKIKEAWVDLRQSNCPCLRFCRSSLSPMCTVQCLLSIGQTLLSLVCQVSWFLLIGFMHAARPCLSSIALIMTPFANRLAGLVVTAKKRAQRRPSAEHPTKPA